MLFPCTTFLNGRNIFILPAILLLLLYLLDGSEGAANARLRCERPGSIANGSFRLKRNFMRVICNNGYVLQGLKTIGCVHGKWDGDKPVCARKGCPKNLQAPANGRIQIESDLKAILYCSDNYSLAGNRNSYCNGTHWDRPIGTCRERSGKVSHECDFETDDVCGWSYEPMANLEWKRVMAANVFTSFKTGPRHDHTTMTHNGGHYMLMESLIRQDTPVTLTSPIYGRELSLKTACCFQFHYFMYGAGVGDLLVVVKPVSISLDEILLGQDEESTWIKFERNGNQNNIWNEAHFNIEEMDEDFQIVFVAKSSKNHLSDIAVDDVRLLMGDDCKALDKSSDDTLSNEEFDTTTYQSLFEIQSCAGRCFSSFGIGIVFENDHLRGLCSCSADCEDTDTCCPDFKSVCLTELFESTTVESNDIAPDTTTPTTTSTTPQAKITSTPNTTTITTTPTTQKTTSTTTSTSTSTTTTTTMKTTSTTTTVRTTPKTTPKPTTTSTSTSTTKKTTPKATATTPKTTTTSTRIPLPPIKPSLKTSKSTKMAETTTTPKTTSTAKPKSPTTPSQDSTVPNATIATRPMSKTYVINNDPKAEAAHRGSTLLMWTLIVLIIVVVAGISYRRFGDRAVAWYMIHFKKDQNGDEDTSSIAASFKRPTSNKEREVKSGKTKPRKKKSFSTDYTRPLVDDDDEYDENAPINGNLVIKNNIYTEL
ncbi:uncharacterized protein LOC142226057 [Haematobia irritans]|uniref:uncharacterized protein LOC142226057 n=1 Tax=Haematobia irritans TaxID=7368 RepID=UPI003F506E96